MAVILVLWCGLATAQDEILDDPVAALEEARSSLEALGEPESDDDRAWQEAAAQRIDLLEELLRTNEQRAALPEIAGIELRHETAAADLESERAAETPASITLEDGAELADYEGQLNTARAIRDTLDTRRRELRTRRQSESEERQRLSRRTTVAQEFIEQTAADSELDSYLIENARLDSRVARERATYLVESDAASTALVPVIDLELETATLRADRARAVFELARAEATRLRELEAQREREAAERQALAARAERDPIERYRREILAEMATRRADIRGIQNELDELKLEIAAVEEQNENLATERRRLERRLDLRRRGADDLLRLNRDSTEQHLRFLRRVTLPAQDVAIQRNQQRLVEVLDRTWAMQMPQSENAELLALLDSVEEERNGEAREVFRDVVRGDDGLVATLRTQRRLLETTESRYGELAVILAEQQRSFEHYIDYLNSQLIWIRSDIPIDSRTIAQTGSELTVLIKRATSPVTWSAAVAKTSERPILVLTGVALIVLLILTLPRVRHAALGPADDAALAIAGRSLPRPVVVTLWCLQLPFILALAARLLKAIGLPSDLDPTVPHLLELLAVLFLAKHVNFLLLGPDGVLERRLLIQPGVASQLFRSLNIAIVSGMLFYVPRDVLSSKPYDFEHLPRLFETAWFVGLATAMILVLRPGGAIVQNSTTRGGGARSAVMVIAPLWIAFIAAAIFLALLGYRLAASGMLKNDAVALVTILFLRAFWVYLNRWSLKVTDRVRTRVLRVEGSEAATAKAEGVLNLLTRVGNLIILVIAGFVVLQLSGAGAPGVRFLEGVHLVELEDGWLTLWDVALALLWITAGHLVAHNIGRIYEAIIAPLAGERSGGSRFAFLTISRYTILLVAYLIALLTLKFSPSSLGWIMTAVSVGLGFGLQEIVANFVSGLILLFEQPIRVGDIVTVGTTGGTVEKINIRATVVTNWEKQTIIVPNKNFITQNVINWTRNDQIMRRTLDVRVKFGEDVEKVLRLLDDVVGAHPKVLEEPPHRIWFSGFGDYGLEFQVWFFTVISDGLSTRTDLNALIYRRLKAEGIEIPLLLRELQTEPLAEQEQDKPAAVR